MEPNQENLSTIALHKQLLTMSVPTMVGFLLQSLYDLVDMFWIGRIDSASVAGVTLFSSMMMFALVLNQIIGVSSISLISQNFGRKDMEATRIAVEQTISFKIVMAVISSAVILILLDPWLGLFTKDPAVFAAAKSYAKVRLYFMPFFFASYSVNTALRNIGHPEMPMKFMIFTSITNMILDPILMFDTIPFVNLPGLGMGAKGAAWATVITTTLAFFWGLILLFSDHYPIRITWKGLFTLVPSVDKALLSIGAPSGVEGFLRTGASMIVLALIGTYGTTAITLAGISQRLGNFFMNATFGLEMGASSLVGYYLGKESVATAKRTVRATVFYSSLLGLITFALYIIIPKTLLGLLVNDAKVVALGVPMMRIFSIGLFGFMACLGFHSAFSGSGYNRPLVNIAVIAHWGVELPLLFLFANILRLPMSFLWVATSTALLVSAGFTFYYYKKETWLYNRVH